MKPLRATEIRVSHPLVGFLSRNFTGFQREDRENPEKASPVAQPVGGQYSPLPKPYPDIYCCAPCEIHTLLYRKRAANTVALGNCWKPTAVVRGELENKKKKTLLSGQSRNTCSAQHYVWRGYRNTCNVHT